MDTTLTSKTEPMHQRKLVKEILSEGMSMKDREKNKIIKSKTTGKQSLRAVHNTQLMVSRGLPE